MIPFERALVTIVLLGCLAFALPIAGLAGQANPPVDADDSGESRLLISHKIEANTEFLWSSDIDISQSALAYDQTVGRWNWKLTGLLKTFEEEYQPQPLYDPLGVPELLEEETYGAQAEVRYAVLDRLTLQASGGYYEGFDGYRSVWLNTYYKQGFENAVEYRDADPDGYNIVGGVRWEYLTASGYLEANLGYYQDDVAPGYEVLTDPITGSYASTLRGRESLDTFTYQVAGENILTRWLRTRVQFQITDTTDRELRYALQGSVNLALGHSWVWRNSAGFASEDPTFDGWFASSSLEWAPWAFLLISASGHYYNDTGEILNSLQLTSGAPGLEAWQYGLGIRFQWAQVALKFFTGPYFTNYDDLDQGSLPLANLYKDRDWWLAQAALDVQF